MNFDKGEVNISNTKIKHAYAFVALVILSMFAAYFGLKAYKDNQVQSRDIIKKLKLSHAPWRTPAEFQRPPLAKYNETLATWNRLANGAKQR